MTLFLDTHPLYGFKKSDLIDSVDDGADEFGVSVYHLFFNESQDTLYCVCDAPNKEAVIKHHQKFNVTCDSITEIDQIMTPQVLLENKLQTLGEIAGRIAHDVRNPLSVVKNTMELYRIRNKEKLSDKDTEDLERVSRAVQRIQFQIDDVLNYLRDTPLVLQETSIESILKDSLDRIIVPDTVKIILPKNNLLIKCDPRKLSVVFVNLLTNAIQAMDESGKLIIDASENDSQIIIKIKDSGPGISQELKPKIFKPLFTTKQMGTGLGLTSCKRIIEKHGGKISVENDNGAVFTFSIPK